MKRVRLLSLFLIANTMSTSFAEEKRPEDLARQYTDAFLAGDMQTLFEHAGPELKAAMKDVETMKGLRANTVGEQGAQVNEQAIAVYTRMVQADSGRTFSITATVSADGKLLGFLIQPAGEAPSKFLDYQTKAVLHLPFGDTWNVFWGGRSVKENYHAAFPDQRFAYDLLMLRDGKSHQGDGRQNSDYFCFEQPIVSPGAGLVAAVVDGIADNVPGKMNPAEPCGNHVVIDLGNKEYLFLGHCKNGSLRVKAGDRVTAGQLLGLCGNSGNSSEPHLHIHLQTTPNYGAGEGLPIQFQHYQANGKPIQRGEPTKGQAICDGAKP